MESRIYDAFEIPPESEWDKHLESELFKKMSIDSNQFDIGDYDLDEFAFEGGVKSCINQHNEKVGTLIVSYILCRHYYDKGIPDDPWYESPGKDGQSIEYMPNFTSQDLLVRYWFSYFYEYVYFKIFSIWDSIYVFINDYYQMGHEQKSGFNRKVTESLKEHRSDICDLFTNISKEYLYKEANKYRNRIIHGTSLNGVTSGFQMKKNYKGKMPVMNKEGQYEINEGKIKMEERNVTFKLSDNLGEYIKCETIMNNIDQFCIFTGDKIEEVINLIKKDKYKIRA